MALFTVIIPTYDRPTLLAEAIDSVLRQTVQDFEVIVVDDGSRVPAVVPDDPRFLLIRHDSNRGLSVARNAALVAATGEYITFLDDDDLFMPRRLEKVDGPLTLCLAQVDGSAPNPVRPDRFPERWPGPHIGQCTIRRDLCPSFDKALPIMEDFEWWIRVRELASPSIIPQVGYIYRTDGGPGLWRNDNNRQVRVECMKLILEKHVAFLAGHRNFAARQWKLVGGSAMRLGDRRLARKAFTRSLRIRPSAKTLAHLTRAVLGV